MILYETLNQPHILFVIIVCGFFCGIFFDLANIISFLCNDNKITKNILLFLATTLCFFVLFFVNQKINYGQFRLYIFVFFFAFLIFERLTLGKLVAKTKMWCYNLFRKFITKVKEKWKHKKQKKNSN